jgi:hypothetical protein
MLAEVGKMKSKGTSSQEPPSHLLDTHGKGIELLDGLKPDITLSDSSDPAPVIFHRGYGELKWGPLQDAHRG